MASKRRGRGFDHRAHKRRKDRIVSERKKERDKEREREAELERQKELEDAQRAVRGPLVVHR